MADEVSPNDARAREFDVVRRGYDRSQVDETVRVLVERIDVLEAGIEEARSTALSVGIDDREALANELHRIGDEVASVLESAREAAEGLRKRAATDADRWRSEARSEAEQLMADAREQSQSMRASAWNEGSSLLSSAVGEANKLLAEAQEEALFMRAEAERDALRLTTDAKRDKDEALRTARQEAEAILEDARRESDGVLASAHKQAEVAQERARALEDRRSELLAELEATRDSISHLEQEIDSRRQELEAPEPEPEPQDDRAHHSRDVGSVKIVAGSRAMSLRPVDPDELVAEVEAMRASTAQIAGSVANPIQAETVAVIAPPPASQDTEQTSDVGSQEPEVTEQKSDVGSQKPKADELDQPVVEPETVAPVEHVEVADDSGDEIGSLFAQLRSEPEQPKSAVRSQESEVHRPAVQTSQAEGQTSDPEPNERPPEREEPKPERANAVLAARNEALKEVKRALVELQNESLEALRVDESWVPDDTFMHRFEPGLARLAEGVDSVDVAAAAREFAADLQDAVTSAIEHARETGDGTRAVGSAASRVFRSWRSNEAERRITSYGPALSS